MKSDGSVSRRTVLAAGLSSCVAGIGGCSGFGGSAPTETDGSRDDGGGSGSAGDGSASGATLEEGWPTVYGDLARSGATSAAGPTGGVDEAWHFDADVGFETSAVASDGTVYALDREGELHALSLDGGAESWTRSLGSDASGVAVAGDDVVVQDAGIAVLDAASGETRWEMDLQSAATEVALVADLPRGGENGGRARTIVTADRDADLVAIDPAQQSIAWRFSTQGTVRGTPSYADGRIYVVSDEFLYAFESGTGNNVWLSDLGNVAVRAPTVVDGTVYAGDASGDVHAVDATTGETAWTAQLHAWPEAGLAVGDGTVFAGTVDEQVHGIDAATGEKSWTFDTDGAITGAPVLADSTLYVPSEDGHCYALDASTGAFEWRFAATDAIATTPAVLNGRLYVGDASGRFYALTSGSTVGENPNALSDTAVEGSWPSWHYDDRNTGHTGRDGPLEDAVERWDHSLPSRPDGLLAMDGTVYLSTIDEDRPLFAGVDAATGERERQWTHEDLSVPISLGNESVYASTAGSIHSFDRAEGTRNWRTELGRGRARVTVQDDRLLVPNVPLDDGFTSRLTALDPVDGTISWSFDLGDRIEYPIAVAGETAYVSTGEALVAADLSERAEKWSVTLEGEVASAPTATDETVYVLGSRGRLHAFERGSGRRRWTTDVPFGTRNIGVADDVVVAAGQSVAAVEKADGSERWSADAGGSSGEFLPVIGETAVYVPNLGGVSAFDLATGERRWQMEMDEPELFGGLVLVDELLVTSHGNEVVAYQEARR